MGDFEGVVQYPPVYPTGTIHLMRDCIRRYKSKAFANSLISVPPPLAVKGWRVMGA